MTPIRPIGVCLLAGIVLTAFGCSGRVAISGTVVYDDDSPVAEIKNGQPTPSFE